ncbi:MAG TPA: Ldh family oxidoreductase [Anaerolineaceae bacterium]|nr:Ldh family oxidoreductase [Anaerolineaceae bacterium]
MRYYMIQDLKVFAARYLTHWNVSEEDAALAADVLVSADMRGVDSHGLIRLQNYYGSRLEKGLIDPRAQLTVLRDTPTTLALDANNGLGHPAGVKTMRQCIEKARNAGLAMATVRHSNHYGIAGYYAMMALNEGMIGISFTNSGPLVAPTHGRKAMLGTNPIAVVVPAGSSRPYVLDMATSIVPIGRISVYQKNGKPIPAGWGIDGEGIITEDPVRVIEGGALMPLGGPELMRGYKGYGLALLVDIFSGVLAGAGFSEQVYGSSAPGASRIGHFFAAIRIDAFRDPAAFAEDMDALLGSLRDSPKAAGEERIFIHGEKEFEKADRAIIEGVPLSDITVETLINAGESAGLPFDLTPIKID